jgi:hypothetical protein
MSYASMALTIAVVLNLGLFLAGSPEVNSPALALLKGLITGNFETVLSSIFTLRNTAIIGVVALVAFGISSAMSPASVLLGSNATQHALTILAIGIFASLFLMPNIGAMAIPEPVATIIEVFLGFIAVLAIFGLLRGE